MDIRPAYQGDYREWEKMIADYVPQLVNVAPRAWSRFFVPQPKDFCWLAIEDDQPVGFMQFTFHDFPFSTKPICYMDSIYVRPEYRGRGIASKLLEALKGIGIVNGWGRIYWVTEHNNPARALYDKIANCSMVRYNQDL